MAPAFQSPDSKNKIDVDLCPEFNRQATGGNACILLHCSIGPFVNNLKTNLKLGDVGL
jgi:hypothetical protein